MPQDWTREELENDILGKMQAVTIPVNISFKGGQKVLDLTQAEDILRKAEIISQEECWCRQNRGNCIEPMDGCLSLNDEARETIGKGRGSSITVEEALGALRRTHDAGLVHMAYTFTGKDSIGVICSCCSCCCHSLSAAVRFGYQEHIFGSEKIAKQNREACTECGMCVERCQFGARSIKENADQDLQHKEEGRECHTKDISEQSVDDRSKGQEGRSTSGQNTIRKILYDPEQCFGCGVCLSTCPANAITMVPREVKS